MARKFNQGDFRRAFDELKYFVGAVETALEDGMVPMAYAEVPDAPNAGPVLVMQSADLETYCYPQDAITSFEDLIELMQALPAKL